MAIDTSIWGNANKPTVALQDPTDLLARMASAKNAVNQNRLFQAREQAGQAAQAAIDPNTGLQSQQVLGQNLAGLGPDAAIAVPDAVAAGQTQATSQLAASQARAAYLQNGLGALMSQNGGKGPDMDDVHAFLDAGKQSGNLDDQTIKSALMGMPNGDDARSRTTRQHMLEVANDQLVAAQQRNVNVAGSAGTVDDGQQLQPVGVGGIRGPAPFAMNPAGTPTQLYPSRAQLSGRTTVGLNPDGSPQTGPLANVTPPNLAGPAGAAPLGDGRFPTLPPALLNPNKPGRAAAVPNDGVVTTGQGPAAAAAATETGGVNAKAFAGITEQGVASQGQNATLGNMLADAGQFTSGMTKANDFKTFATRQAPSIAAAFGIDPAKVSAQESFDKLAAQIASQQGAGSDARLAVAQTGNPSSHLTPQGVDMILRQLQGNADFNQARSKLADAWPNKADRSGFENGPAANIDPRAFQFQRLTPAQRQTYVDSLSKPDAIKVRKSYNFAAQNGLLPVGQ